MSARKPRRSLAAVLTYAPAPRPEFRFCAACNTPPGSPHICADCYSRQTAYGRGDDSVALPPALPDPTCARDCGTCWACRRKKDGPDWWAKRQPKAKS